MKRLLLMLSIFAVMFSFIIFEFVYLNNFYSDELKLLHKVEMRFDEDPENLNRAETIEAFEMVVQKWKEGKSFVMLLSNHNTSKVIEEKFVAIKELIRMNQEYDAYVTLKTVIAYITELKHDLLPVPSNLL